MAMIKIDGEEYDLESLSDESKAQLASLRFVDAELAQLQARSAALQTARIAYGRALKESLEKGVVTQDEDVTIEGLGDSIEFD